MDNKEFPTPNKIPFGFDRTQMWKEHEGPMIRRQSALNAAQSFYSNNRIEYTATELKLLYERFLHLIETGETTNEKGEDFFKSLDNYINKTKK